MDYKSSVVYVQKDGYVLRLKPETTVGGLYDSLGPCVDLRFSNSKTGAAAWPIYSEQLMTSVFNEPAGVGSMLGDHKTRVTALEARVTSEESARFMADMSLDSKVTAEAATRLAADSKLATDLVSEAAIRLAADAAHDAQIAQEISDRVQNDYYNTTAINTEKSRAQNAEYVLQQSDAQFTLDMAAEAKLRTDGDAFLQAQIGGLWGGIQTIESDSKARDSALGVRCDGLVSDLSTEVAARLALKAEFDSEVLLARSEEKKLSDRIQFVVSNTDPAHLDSLAEIVASFGVSSGALLTRVQFLEGIVQELVDRSV